MVLFDQFKVATIKFGKCFAEFMIPIALLKEYFDVINMRRAGYLFLIVLVPCRLLKIQYRMFKVCAGVRECLIISRFTFIIPNSSTEF